MQKRTAIVTGGTSGIGLSLVKTLVKNSYKVYFIGTNWEKGKEIELSLSESKAEFVPLDLGDLIQVQEFIQKFKEQNGKLDLLANIAGVLLPDREETTDKIEKTFAVSYLSVFHLTNELVSLLEKSHDARIVNVAGNSSLILNQKLNFNDLNFRNNYNGIKASTLAVHAKTVFTQSLSEKLIGSSVTVNSFNPGYIKSGLFRNMSGFQKAIMKIISPFFASESKMGNYISLSNEIKGVTGKIFDGKKVITLHFDKVYREKLWQESEVLIKQVMG